MRRPAIAVAALLLLLSPVASTRAEAPAVQAYGHSEGVAYYMASGSLDSSFLTFASPSGPKPLPFQGCVFLQLRPDLGHGIVRVKGAIGNDTTLDLLVNDLVTPKAGVPALATNVTVAAQAGEEAHEPVPADVEGWGPARMDIDGTTYPDPSHGRQGKSGTVPQNETEAHFFVTPAGFRDDASGAVTIPGDDPEVHVHLASIAGPAAPAKDISFAPTGDLPDGSLLPAEAYTALYTFENTRFGGRAALQATAQANALPGDNRITFEVRSPSGLLVANQTLSPALQAPAAADLAFDLDEFGTYSVWVQGKVSLAKYSIAGQLQPAATFAFDLWWNHALRGPDAVDQDSACEAAVETGSASGLTALKVGRPKPPQYEMEAVVLAVGAAAVAVSVAVTLIVHKVGSGAFRKTFRER